MDIAERIDLSKTHAPGHSGGPPRRLANGIMFMGNAFGLAADLAEQRPIYVGRAVSHIENLPERP